MIRSESGDKTSVPRRIKPRSIVLVTILAIIIVLICIVAYSIGPENIVERIGITNGYLLIFVFSFFAGFSALTSVSFYTMLITLISGGLDPVVLALLSGISLAFGDSFLFWFGRKGRDIITGRVDRAINRMTQYFQKRNRARLIPYFAYIYMSVIPLPNDWLLLFLASIRFPQKKMFLIITLGDITHTSLITFLAIKGIKYFG